MIKTPFLIASLVFWPILASADPATHTFGIVSAQSSRGDCGGGTCTDICRLKGKVTNVSASAFPSVQLTLMHAHPGLDSGMLGGTTFAIPSLEPRKSAAVVQWINGLKCSQVRIQSATARCDSTFCPYGAVRISPSAVPPVGGMKVEITR